MPFGPIFQLGYLVDALEPAMKHWTDAFGAGPFFVLPPRRFAALTVDGVPTDDDAIIADVALGQLGHLQIELIVPGPAPSTYHHFLDAGQRGLHHVGILVDDFDGKRADALAAGYVPETEGQSALTRIAYLRPPSTQGGSVIELVETCLQVDAAFGRVRDAADGWDGRDPVRQF
ncbi:VOC family protein [Sphingomonas sp. 1P06PA]|uniref:VOC family protein n=1 Tax=Sphingomonas sp. 1P06PA TaxID=554121 RepID=UPI0039A55B15